MKKIAVFILIIFISVLLSACWSSEEPKDLAIINSAIYDIDDQGNFTVTMQIINSSAIGSTAGASTSGQKNPSIVIVGKGTTITDAVYDLTCRIEKSLFAAHNKVRFISERLASNDLYFRKFLDYLFRDTLTDETALMVVVRNEDLDKIYTSAIGLGTYSGNFLEDLHVKKQAQSSSAVFLRTFEFLRDCYEDGKQPVLGQLQFTPTVEIPSLNPGGENKQAKYEMKSEGIAVFKDFKFVGYLYGKDTEVYNIVTNNAKLVNFDIRRGEDYASFTLSKPKSDIKVTKQGGQIYVDIKIKGKITLANFLINGVNDDNYYDKIEEVEKEANSYLSQVIMASVKKGMEFNSDIYGFGQTLHQKNPSLWREVSKDWNNYFTNAVVNVESNTIIEREGELNRPFIKEQK